MTELTKARLKALWEMIKEGLRLAFFAGIAAFIQWALDVFIPGLDPQYAVYTPVLTFVLRLADKYIHEHKMIKANGIAPF